MINISSLTRAEMAVYLELIQGLTNEEISSQIGITVSTVKFHTTSILAKLGMKSKLKLITAHYRGQLETLTRRSHECTTSFHI